MIPETLDECFPALDELLVDKDKEYLQKAKDPDDAVIGLHHSLGQFLRNEWGLWKDSALAQHLRQVHGIDHPDDMSHLILTRYCRVRYPTLWDRLAKDDGSV